MCKQCDALLGQPIHHYSKQSSKTLGLIRSTRRLDILHDFASSALHSPVVHNFQHKISTIDKCATQLLIQS